MTEVLVSKGRKPSRKDMLAFEHSDHMLRTYLPECAKTCTNWMLRVYFLYRAGPRKAKWDYVRVFAHNADKIWEITEHLRNVMHANSRSFRRYDTVQGNELWIAYERHAMSRLSFRHEVEKLCREHYSMNIEHVLL